MNLNHYCPVQASIDSYCARDDYDDPLGDAIDNRKEELMKMLDAKDIYDAFSEACEDEDLLKAIASAFSQVDSGSRVSLTDAEAIISGLFCAVERAIEKLAEQQIKKEWDDPQ